MSTTHDNASKEVRDTHGRHHCQLWQEPEQEFLPVMLNIHPTMNRPPTNHHRTHRSCRPTHPAETALHHQAEDAGATLRATPASRHASGRPRRRSRRPHPKPTETPISHQLHRRPHGRRPKGSRVARANTGYPSPATAHSCPAAQAAKTAVNTSSRPSWFPGPPPRRARAGEDTSSSAQEPCSLPAPLLERRAPPPPHERQRRRRQGWPARGSAHRSWGRPGAALASHTGAEATGCGGRAWR